MIDAEHAFDAEYAMNLGVDVDNLLVCQPESGEMALEGARCGPNVMSCMLVSSRQPQTLARATGALHGQLRSTRRRSHITADTAADTTRRRSSLVGHTCLHYRARHCFGEARRSCGRARVDCGPPSATSCARWAAWREHPSRSLTSAVSPLGHNVSAPSLTADIPHSRSPLSLLPTGF
jgi:hypothetical protein